LPGEERVNFRKYFKISRCIGGCLIDRKLVFGPGQRGPFKTQTMVSTLFIDSGLADYSGVAAADDRMDNKQMSKDGFVKSPKTVMPDLIRHPEVIVFTGFRLSPE